MWLGSCIGDAQIVVDQATERDLCSGLGRERAIPTTPWVAWTRSSASSTASSVFWTKNARRLPPYTVLLADIRKDQDLVREGDRPTRSFAIVEGCAFTYKHVAGGKRQISAFHIAGDIPDLQSLHLGVLDVSIATITPCKLAFIPHPTMLRLCEAFPRITAAFWRETLIEAAVAREWVANVGRRRASARIAHVLCEVLRAYAGGRADRRSWLPVPDQPSPARRRNGNVGRSCQPQPAGVASGGTDQPERSQLESAGS